MSPPPTSYEPYSGSWLIKLLPGRANIYLPEATYRWVAKAVRSIRHRTPTVAGDRVYQNHFYLYVMELLRASGVENFPEEIATVADLKRSLARGDRLVFVKGEEETVDHNHSISSSS